MLSESWETTELCYCCYIGAVGTQEKEETVRWTSLGSRTIPGYLDEHSQAECGKAVHDARRQAGVLNGHRESGERQANTLAL